MANLVNDLVAIEKALPGEVDKVFAAESYTDALIGSGEIKINFVDARTIRIFKLASTALQKYNRGGHGSSNEEGAASSSYETFTLSQERWSSIPLDKLDSLDDGGTVLGHLAKEFIRVHVVHEFDTYRFGVLAGCTSVTIGNRVEGDIADNQVIIELNKALKWFSEQKVPNEERICYCSPLFMQKLRNSSEINRYLRPDDMDKNIKFGIEIYQGMKLVEVPSDTFYTNPIVGDGIYPGSNSKLINFLIVWKKAPIIAKRLAFVKTYSSDEVDLGYVGYKLDNLYYHDIFVPDNKKLAIYCSVSTVSALSVGSGLKVDAVASSVVGQTLIRNVITQPAGSFYDALYLCNSATAPAIGSVATAYTQIYLNVPFTPDATNNIIIAAKDGKVAFVSDNFGANLPIGS